MAEADINVPALNKDITFEIVAGDDREEALNEIFHHVSSMIAHGQLRDADAGLEPDMPTHEVVRGDDDKYRIQRLGFA